MLILVLALILACIPYHHLSAKLTMNMYCVYNYINIYMVIYSIYIYVYSIHMNSRTLSDRKCSNVYQHQACDFREDGEVVSQELEKSSQTSLVDCCICVPSAQTSLR